MSADERPRSLAEIAVAVVLGAGLLFVLLMLLAAAVLMGSDF